VYFTMVDPIVRLGPYLAGPVWTRSGPPFEQKSAGLFSVDSGRRASQYSSGINLKNEMYIFTTLLCLTATYVFTCLVELLLDEEHGAWKTVKHQKRPASYRYARYARFYSPSELSMGRNWAAKICGLFQNGFTQHSQVTEMGRSTKFKNGKVSLSHAT
jgi:hypothetical protein